MACFGTAPTLQIFSIFNASLLRNLTVPRLDQARHAWYCQKYFCNVQDTANRSKKAFSSARTERGLYNCCIPVPGLALQYNSTLGGAATAMGDAASQKSTSLSGSFVSNGTKRKRVAEPKFYAVRVGYQPGIYHTWADCLEQVKGYKKALCEDSALSAIPIACC